MENYEKKYKSALEWMRSIYPTMQGADKEDAEHYFPELKESEDERIRKEIIQSIQDNMCVIHKDKCLAWLEKQGEQKPVEERQYIRKIIDTTTNKVIEYQTNDGLFTSETNSAWSEEDEKMISLLIKIFEINHPNEHFKVNSIGTTNMEAMSIKEILDWLKSLKPQKNWKPSEEQMEAIKYFIDFHRPQANASTEGWKEFENLERLYNNLLKL